MVPTFSVVRGSAGIGVSARAAAAQGLGHGRVRARAVEHNVRSDASGEGCVRIQMAHAAQIALALFSHVADEEQRCRHLGLGMQ